MAEEKKEEKKKEETKTVNDMKITKCDCVHAFQDETYGKGMRAHNPRKSGAYRCTVCGKEKK